MAPARHWRLSVRKRSAGPLEPNVPALEASMPERRAWPLRDQALALPPDRASIVQATA